MRLHVLAQAYLALPTGDDVSLRGMKWSPDRDAIEDADGRTVCVVEQLQEVLHGAFSGGSIPYFSHVVSLLGVARFGGRTPEFERLQRIHAECSTASALSRNTGALFAHLCSGFHVSTHPPKLDEVIETLAARRRNGSKCRIEPELTGVPPISEVVPRFLAKLAGLSDDQLRHWFRFGNHALPSDDRIAEELESLPLRVLKLIAAARTSQRLVGAASLLPALDAGLTIPPRKKSPDAVPQGGYADVTTRGDPDRLLPSQFALDPDEFVRRFAERELLYFQREEPHETQKPERVLVFDQGVRTWGRVRLALAGAVLSLLKYDARRIGDARLFVTSQPEPVALRTAKIEHLQEVLEASDFTNTPHDAIHSAIEEAEAGAAPRDLILLTHPLNAASVLEFAESQRPGDRIFTLTVDDEGTARLAELRSEGFVPVRTFRLDLQAAAEETVQGERPSQPKPFTHWRPWTGDVEPIGFPFRPGIVADVDVLGFSAEGDWLVAGSHGGVLHAIACDGSCVEVLPRGIGEGRLSRAIGSILPVYGGIVAVGHPVQGYGSAHVVRLTHYDFTRREVRVYEVGSYDQNISCLSWPEQNCVVAFVTVPKPLPVRIVDLQLQQVIEFNLSKLNVPEHAEALRSPQRLAIPLTLSRWDMGMKGSKPEIGFEIYSNLVKVFGTGTRWEPFMPRMNGEPFIKGSSIRCALAAGPTLAMALSDAKERSKLMLFRAPDGRILMEFPHLLKNPFTLSSSGESVAIRRNRREVAVHATAAQRDPEAIASPAKLHDQLQLSLSAQPWELRAHTGGHEHTFTIRGSSLWHGVGGGSVPRPQFFEACDFAAYDLQRFPGKSTAVADKAFHAVHDRLGLIHLVAKNTTLVASFCIRRELAAAWIPGGVFWGSPALIGGPPHPDAARIIGQAILNAGGAE